MTGKKGAQAGPGLDQHICGLGAELLGELVSFTGLGPLGPKEAAMNRVLLVNLFLFRGRAPFSCFRVQGKGGGKTCLNCRVSGPASYVSSLEPSNVGFLWKE